MTEAVNMDKVYAMVQGIMSVFPPDASHGEVMIAMSRAAALMSYLIGHACGNDGYDVLDDLINLIEENFDNQTVMSVTTSEH